MRISDLTSTRYATDADDHSVRYRILSGDVLEIHEFSVGGSDIWSPGIGVDRAYVVVLPEAEQLAFHRTIVNHH